MSPFRDLPHEILAGQRGPALLRSSWDPEEGQGPDSLPSRVCCWIVSISFTRRFGRPPG
jgi:hypothetical protein